jgi:hypothetical protein
LKEKHGLSWWYLWGTGEANTGFWWGSLSKGDQLEGLNIDRRIIIKWIFNK